MAAIGFPLPRFFLALLFAAMTTVALAYLMHVLIKTEAVDLEPKLPIKLTEWVRAPDEPLPPPERERVQPPPKVVEEPPPPQPQTAERSGYTELASLVFTPPGNAGPTGPSTGHADGDLLPIVAITPDYPARAKSRGIEGYVTLEFTVNARGQVENPRVLDASPPGIFDTAALRAIERFRYRPRVVAGRPMVVNGVKTRLRFTLD